jgi:phage gp16-like protein
MYKIRELQAELTSVTEQASIQYQRAQHTDGQAYHAEMAAYQRLNKQRAELQQRLNDHKNRRSRELAKIAIACGQNGLSLTDSTRRSLILRITEGRTDSRAELNAGERTALLDELNRLGWQPKRTRKLSPKRDGLAGKLNAYWIQMGKDNLIRDASERALGRYCLRMTGTQSPDWLSTKDAQKVLESLKQWRTRLENEKC